METVMINKLNSIKSIAVATLSAAVILISVGQAMANDFYLPRRSLQTVRMTDGHKKNLESVNSCMAIREYQESKCEENDVKCYLEASSTFTTCLVRKMNI